MIRRQLHQFAIGMVAVACGLAVLAAEQTRGPGEKGGSTDECLGLKWSAELEDPTFEQIASIRLIGDALRSADPCQITDVATLVLHGERLLCRLHRGGVRSEVLFSRALSLAGAKSDRNALARLAAVAEAHGLKRLKEDLDGMAKLHGEGRGVERTLVLNTDNLNIDEILGIRVACRWMEEAAATGDSGWLDRISAVNLPLRNEDRDVFLERLKKAQQLAATAPDADLLRLLAAESRALADLAEFNKSIAELGKAGAEQYKAWAEVTKASGEYLVHAAEARLKDQESAAKRIENSRLYAEVFWAKRKMWEENRRKRQERSAAGWARFVSEAKPKPLSDFSWPHIFSQPVFLELKNQIADSMSSRTPENSGLGSESCLRLQVLVKRMEYLLASHVREIPPVEYVHAKRFLASLAYEATRPLREPAPSDGNTPPEQIAAINPETEAAPFGFSPWTTIVDPKVARLARAWWESIPNELALIAVELAEHTTQFRLPDGADLADEVYRLCVRLALISEDQSTLQQLEVAATRWKRDDLKKIAHAAADLIAKKQVKSSPSFAIEVAPIESILLCRAYMADVRAAVLQPAPETLRALLESLQTAPIPDEQKEYIRQIALQEAHRQIAAESQLLWTLLPPAVGERVVAALETSVGLRPPLIAGMERDLGPAATQAPPAESVAKSLLSLYDRLVSQ